MRAENGIGRVVNIRLGVIADALNDLLFVVAGVISCRPANDPALAGGVGRKSLGIAVHLGNGRNAGYDAAALGVEFSAHCAHVAYGAAYLLRRNLDAKIIPRLEQHAFCLHKSLPHRAIHGLAEIAALGVLYMRPAGYEAYLHIRKRRACQNAEMRFFRKVCHYKALPIAVKLVQGTAAFKAQPRAALGRLDEQVHLGIVSQRLEMPDAVHRLCYGLLIGNAARCYAHVKIKPLADKLGEHLSLHLAHYFHAYLAQALAPLDLQLRILVLELLELPVGNKRVGSLRQRDLI